MHESDRSQTENAIPTWHRSGHLQETLCADEVSLETRAERIAAPGDARSVETGAAEKGVVKESAERFACGQLGRDRAAHDGEDISYRQAILREESIRRGPIMELRTGRAEQAGDGMATEAKQRTQGEGLGAVGDALLVEGWGDFVPELEELREDASRVFFKAEGGGCRRRKASSALSSMIHSTVSPRENSMACATADGRLTYHCSLALRLMSCTLV